MRHSAGIVNNVKVAFTSTSTGVKEVTTVRQLKRKYDDVPLSFLFGISQEVDYQCPTIDEYIDKIELCRRHLDKAKRARTLETKDGHILRAMYALSDIDVDLDKKTRENFIRLRETVREWKGLAIRLLNVTRTPEKFVTKKWNK